MQERMRKLVEESTKRKKEKKKQKLKDKPKKGSSQAVSTLPNSTGKWFVVLLMVYCVGKDLNKSMYFLT